MPTDNLPPELRAMITGFLPPSEQLRLRLVNRASRDGFDAMSDVERQAARDGAVAEAQALFQRLINLVAVWVGKGAADTLKGFAGELRRSILATLVSDGAGRQTAIDELLRELCRLHRFKSVNGVANLLANSGIGTPSSDAIMAAEASYNQSGWCTTM